LQDIVYENLLHLEGNPSFHSFEKGDLAGFEQVIVNEDDEVTGFSRRLLIAATSLNIYDIVSSIHLLGGLAIASHIDREVFGIIGQLGFIPQDLKFDALEISPNTPVHKAKDRFQEYSSTAWITSSDAHHANDIGKVSTEFLMHEATFGELCLALKGVEGRKCLWGQTGE
ncbi:MAG: hypothetical protein HY758_11155, partial [Nitrospirae bacterium]|nr:hypothetical protein [Nitrospirota bacterium]